MIFNTRCIPEQVDTSDAMIRHSLLPGRTPCHSRSLRSSWRAPARLRYELRRGVVESIASSEADESFTIFQDYVRSELLEIDAELRDARLSTVPRA
jgi:hypothetical protein